MTKEKSVDVSGSSRQKIKSERDATNIDRHLPEHEVLERHHSAVTLAEACTSDYETNLWFQAELIARKRCDVIITTPDVQEAFDEMRKGKPQTSSHSWMGVIGGAVLGAGASAFVSGLNGSMNRMIIVSMSLVVIGLLLVFVFRTQP